MDSIPSTSGIYKITCIANKRIYIGSAVNLHVRKNSHFSALQRNEHGNPKMQNAWNKYGEQAFIFEVLEYVLPMSLTAREQYWFEKLKPFDRKGFNIAREAGSALGIKRSPETRERIRQVHLGNNYCLGRKYTPETIEKMRQVQTGRKQSPETIEKRKQYKRTPETLEKYRQNMLGNKHALGHSHEQTAETREKIRQAKLGKKNSPEHNEKVRQANLGKKLSPEHRAKIGQTHLGSKRSPETRERMRQSNRAAWQRRRSNEHGQISES